MLKSIRKSISYKFMAAVMATTFVAVLVSGLTNLAYDLHDFRTSVEEDLSSQADLLAKVSMAALEFDDRESAHGLLQQFRAKPNIAAAAIYGADGKVFATYSLPAASNPAPASVKDYGVYIDGDEVAWTKPIVRSSERLGSVYVRAAYPLSARINRNVKMLGAVLLLSLVVAAFVSSWLQAAVTLPVKAVTRAVRDLIAKRDYSQRVTKTSDDETGVLVEAFNTMLCEIGSHAALLETSNSSLKREVDERLRAETALSELNASLEERVQTRSRELAKATEQLRQAQKMEAIGQLTGGVAHDFNNVLQVISGNLQLLAMTITDATGATQRRLQAAAFATDRGAKLSSQLLAFARRQPLQPVTLNLNRVMRGMDDMLRRSLGESIDLETIVAGGLWNTLIDANQIENAILNLAINARDAMNGEGKLTLELCNAVLDDQYARAEREVTVGQYVMLAVSDTGCGMSKETIERAIEPFFTTKPEGAGTGLGLSMVFGFVKQSGGHLKIYSEVGHGTTIRLYLPRSHEVESVAVEELTSEAGGGNEAILVVEDDLEVQATVVDMLRQLGYRVTSASDGSEALNLLRGGLHVDMLFTDVVMPGPVRSPELAREAKRLLPEVAVLFTSGYTQNAIVHGGRLDPGVELISKPYRREDLAHKIRSLLGARAPSTGVPQTPAAFGRVNAAESAEQRHSAHATKRVLVVEDEPDNRDVLADLLTMLGYETTAAATAEEALGLFDPGKFDVLLTDLNLPGMSGVELAQRLRDRVPEITVIIASGTPLNLTGMDVGRYRQVRKPYHVEELQTLLEAK